MKIKNTTDLTQYLMFGYFIIFDKGVKILGMVDQDVKIIVGRYNITVANDESQIIFQGFIQGVSILILVSH